MKHFMTFILCLFMLNLYAGKTKYSKAVVTDVNYLLRYSDWVNREVFPLYFHFQEFIDDVLSDIDIHVKEKYGVDTVIFLNPGEINYSVDLVAPGIKAKEISQSGESETVYIAVESILQLHAINNGVPVYYFITRVKAYNKGKKVYKFINRIPFTPVIEDDITGIAEMGEQDFYVFYFTGLKMAFEGGLKKDKKWFILKPPTPYYEEFLSQTRKFYLVPQRNSYLYGTSLDDLSEVIIFSDQFFKGLDGEFDLGNLFEGNTVRDSYYLINKLTNEEYAVKIKARESTLLNFLAVSSGVEITLKKPDKEEAGYFDYSYGKLDGTFNNRHYTITWKPEFHCAEIEVDNELKLLVNDLDDRKVLFLHNSLTENDLADILNLAFIYDFAAQAQAKAQAKAENDLED